MQLIVYVGELRKKLISIIECPSNLGLKKKEEDKEPGVNQLPAFLNEHGFHSSLNPAKVSHVSPPPYTMEMDNESGVRNAEKIIKYAKDQAKHLLKELQEGFFPIIIGGDCSILIGSSLALKQKGTYGLFFIDGHTDFIPPSLSYTRGAAGMDLAIVAGTGHPKLTNIQNLGPYFREENIFCVGNREYDKDYVRPVLDSHVHYYDLNHLRETGIEQVTGQFLELVSSEQLDGFFVHLDVDALDDQIMPAVDSRCSGGLTYPELSQLLRPLLSSHLSVGIEITILDPNLDRDGTHTKAFTKEFTDLMHLTN